MQLWDVRSGQETASWPAAHALAVRDVDFARRSAHVVVTTGDDCRLRFWDLRCAPSGQDVGFNP